MDDAGSLDGLSSLIRLTGVGIPARARFIGESLASSLLSGIATGLVCGQIGAMTVTAGPLVPFLWGTWVGSGLGLFAHWRKSALYAEMCADNYPKLMAHALWTSRQIVVPTTIIEASSTEGASGDITLREWMRQGGMGRYTSSVLAATECSAAVQEVENNKRQALIEQLSEREES